MVLTGYPAMQEKMVQLAKKRLQDDPKAGTPPTTSAKNSPVPVKKQLKERVDSEEEVRGRKSDWLNPSLVKKRLRSKTFNV